jgi:hypothetical protein
MIVKRTFFFLALWNNLSPHPLLPWKILEVTVITYRRKTDLPHNFVPAGRLFAFGITIHAKLALFHPVAAGTHIPSGETEERNFKLRHILKLCLRSRRQAEMANPQFGFKTGFPDTNMLDLLASGIPEPIVKTGSDNSTGTLENMDRPNAKRGYQLIAPECGIEAHGCASG